MKEISGELADRDVVICIKCGAIFEKADSNKQPCPECAAMGLYWITPVHGWVKCLRD